MRLLAYLVGFFAARRLRSGVAVLLVVLITALVLIGVLTEARKQTEFSYELGDDFGNSFVTMPIMALDVGSAHTHVWEATNNTYLYSFPVAGGILLPLRLASIWLFLVLPFVGLVLGAVEVSSEVESGVAQSIYATPVRPSVLGAARMIGNTLSALLVICIGLVFALLVGARIMGLGMSAAQLARSAGFVVVLGVYTSLFMLVGNLASTLCRNSVRSLWICVGVGLMVFAVQLGGENYFIAQHGTYPTVPFPPRTVNEYLQSHDLQRSAKPATLVELESDAGPTMYRYLIELQAHGQQVCELIAADYRRERWFALVSPVHAMWEIAGQLLQDRHETAPDIFSPQSPMDQAPSIWVSAEVALPELAGVAVVWLALFVTNVRAMSRLEV